MAKVWAAGWHQSATESLYFAAHEFLVYSLWAMCVHRRAIAVHAAASSALLIVSS
jgi:hypothetical protein